MKKLINWKLFFVLLIICVITSLLVIPYTLELTSNEIEITAKILLITTIQSLVMYAIVVFLGLLVALIDIPFNEFIPELLNLETPVTVWKALLGSFYGGISEEVLLRLFLVSLFVWITLNKYNSLELYKYLFRR